MLDQEARRAAALQSRNRATGRKRPARRRRSRPVRRTWNLGLVITLLVGLYYSPAILDRHIMPALVPLLPWSKVPPPGVEAAAEPLGKPPAGTGSGAFRLQESPDPRQDFVAYDPCRPVHYVIRPENSPAGGEVLIHEAVAEVSAASGLRFVYDGPTAEGPSRERDRYQPGRYGERWAPVLLTWSDPEETPGLTGDVGGLGGSEYAHTPGHPFVYVAGQVMLDAPGLVPILGYPGGAELVRAVVIHELGHVLGLDHVDEPDQLMYGGRNDRTTLAEGDREGLALLGAGACVPQL
ncbi:matrixin family metalloprotease [Paeniglutamicibacter sp. ORCA_105]|uniref:matrixin family metalloprotease n=1 Tax=Paeniglutamicibacter sp. ORCA_105 TaxID=3377336 RepID=UPI0038937184